MRETHWIWVVQMKGVNSIFIRPQANHTGSTNLGGSRTGSRQSMTDSIASSNSARLQYARALNPMTGSLINFADDIELSNRSGHTYQRPGSRQSVSSQGLYSMPAFGGSYLNMEDFGNPFAILDFVPGRRRGLGINVFGRRPAQGVESVRPSTQLLRTIRSIPGRIQGHFRGREMEGIPEESGSALPIRVRMRNVTQRIRGLFPMRAAAVDGDNEPILDSGGKMSIGRFLNTHKRKLIIGGAVLGGAAVIGGTVGGILSAKRKKTMQSGYASEPAGMFQQLSSGSSSGGGGGGSGRSYARVNQIQAAARHYVRRKRGVKRRGGKKHYKKQVW